LGRALGLHEVDGPESFRDRVPVTDEAYYRPFTDRVLESNPPGVVAPGRLRYMARTSGTTAASKHIPYPEPLIKAFKRFETRMAMQTMRLLDDYTLLGGQLLITSGNPTCETTPSGVTVGFGSGIMTLLAPAMAKDLVRPTRPVLELSDWQAKIEATVAEALPLDIRLMTGVPVFVVPILERVLEAARAQGREAPHARALWPNLAAYYWSGSPIGLYEERLRALFGPGVAFREIYATTETAVGFQDRLTEPGLLLDVADTYFEFQPADSPIESPRLGLHEVRQGETYRLLITTWGGLCAYRLGDLVEVVSTEPPRIRIVGREKEEISLGFERLQLSAIQGALEAVAREQGARVINFFLGPDMAEGERKRYHWYVEFEQPPEDPEAFVQAIDARLIAAHPVYAGMRGGDSVLLPPRLTVMPSGAIARYILDTRQFGQGKFLHLYASPDVPQAILRHATS
ncbi:MAG: GH3 auxin-responsive promoter family protein, partial [Candidatus Sericytochromatia bacterium]